MMKAAVIEKLGDTPQYKDFPEPKIQDENQVILNVKAAAVKNLDKLRASGKHYASHTNLPDVVGMDGVGELEDGTKVYAQGITGMIAEKAIVHKDKISEIPKHLDFYTAAALPNAVLGAAMPILVRGKLKKGQNILINGATGFTGFAAIQIAKHYGAKNIIATGRNEEALKKTKELGANITLNTEQDEASLAQELKQIHLKNPIDLVVDYLWGKPIEIIIKALEGGGLNNFTHKVNIISVGSLAGNSIQLSSESLRSSDLHIMGSGFGSLSTEDLEMYRKEILPEMFKLAADKKLKIDLHVDSIENIENLWNEKFPSGKRLVIAIN